MIKPHWIKRTLTFVLAGAMVVCLASAAVPPTGVHAEESEEGSGTGKYVQDVYIAYGKNEKDAAKWLSDRFCNCRCLQ